MLAALVALVLAAAIQVPAPSSPPSDDARAAAGSGFVFAQACLLRMAIDQTPAAYAAGSAELGRGLLKDTPLLNGRLAIDDAEGRGCRVSYRGDEAALAWRALHDGFDLASNPSNGVCRPGVTTAQRLEAVCRSEPAQQADFKAVARTADLAIVRAGSGAHGSVTASLTNLRP